MAKKILVVDDNPLIRQRLRSLLEYAGYEVFEAANGELGLREVQRLTPDLVVADFNMPGLTGGEMVRRLRQARSNIPVIITSLHDDATTRALCSAAGANRFIPKPELSEQLLPAIGELLVK